MVKVQTLGQGVVGGKFWYLGMPNKFKMFDWHACHGILLTKTKLFGKQNIPSYMCEVCNIEVETNIHAI